MERPRLRPLEVLPIQHQGRTALLLRDPLGYSEAVLLLAPEAFYLISHFDGEHTVREAQVAFLRRYGQLVMSHQIEALLQQLDEALFLDNERFRRHREAMEASFRNSPVRSASHAGKSYPEEEGELRALLESFFLHPRGPGRFPQRQGKPLSGLIAPHIDFQRGGHAYAWAYFALGEAEPADLFVVMGTGHAARDRFVLTAKDFETPLGLVPTAKDLVHSLAERLPWSPFEEEWIHKGEHSLEFQVLWLAYLLGTRGDYEILPILLGSFEDLLHGSASPLEQDERVLRFCEALAEVLAASGRRACFIASVDFAHMGTRFGDQQRMTVEFLAWLRRQDQETLCLLAEHDAEGFYRHLVRDRNRRRLDGLATLYVMLQVLPPSKGEVLCYDQAVDSQEHSVVSFASMVYRPE